MQSRSGGTTQSASVTPAHSANEPALPVIAKTFFLA
jgi:hypothetical protein